MNKIKKIKKELIIKTLITLLISGVLFMYCLNTNYYLNAIFVIIFTYYVLRLLIINYSK